MAKSTHLLKINEEISVHARKIDDLSLRMTNLEAKMDHMDMRMDSLDENLKFVVQYVQQQMQKTLSENPKF